MINPLVTVIIPAHNRLQWLEESIRSVILQTYSNIEIIVIDDASIPPIDGIMLLSDPRVKIIRQKKNIGPGSSRELGRLSANGQFINYLDSDDYLHPLKIEKQVRLMIENPEIGMCYCTSAIFENLPITSDLPIWQISNVEFNTILPIILYQRPWPTCSCLWTKKATDVIGPWSSLWVGEDIEYETRAGCRGIKILHLAETMAFIRRNKDETQLTNLSNERLIEATKYLVTNASNITNSPYKTIKSVYSRMIQVLLNHTIFLFTQEKKENALECLEAIIPFLEYDHKVLIINTYKSLTKNLPSKTSVALGRLIRSKVFNRLIEENDYSKYL